MEQIQKGIIHIADISGYTAFLNESELEHAQGTLQSLLEVLIENTHLPLVISRLEGDAVISYATEGSFLQGASVLEMIESSYIAFRRALELMVINTTCTCNACRNIPNLDLKFFIHHGSFGLQPLPAYTELVGTDVNTAHRLTKNHVKQETGYEAYALFTRAAVEDVGKLTHDASTHDHHVAAVLDARSEGDHMRQCVCVSARVVRWLRRPRLHGSKRGDGTVRALQHAFHAAEHAERHVLQQNGADGVG